MGEKGEQPLIRHIKEGVQREWNQTGAQPAAHGVSRSPRDRPVLCEKALVSSRFRERQRRAAAAALLSASNTIAAPVDREPVRLIYRAPVGCPAEARFWDEVAARTDRVRLAEGTEPARVFSVSVDARPGESRGDLESTDVQGVRMHREVTGDDCAEVVSALALIAALMVDSQARTDPTPAIPPAATAETAENSATPPGAGTAPTVSPSVPPPIVTVPPAAPTPVAETAAPEKTSSHFRWSIGAEGQALAGLVPAWAFGGGAFVALENDDEGALSPSFRITPWVAVTSATFAGNLGADLTWFAARAEVCPVRPTLAPAVRLAACAGLDAGVLWSSGTGVDHPDTHPNVWFSPLALGRLEWSLSSELRAEIGAGVTVPLDRPQFSFEPSAGAAPSPLFQIRAMGALLTLGAAYRFP